MSNLSQLRQREMLDYLDQLKEVHTDDESQIALEKIQTTLTEKNKVLFGRNMRKK